MTAGAPSQLGPTGTGAATARLPGVAVPERRRLRTPPFKRAIFIALILGLSVLFIYPFVWLISASLKPQADVFDNRLIPRDFANNYWGDPTPGAPGDEALFSLPEVPVATWFMNSVWIGVLGALLVTFSSALVAFAFAYFRFPGRNVLFGLVLATMMLPGAVTMIPEYLIWNELSQITGEGGRFAALPDIGVNTQYPLWVPNLFASAFYIFLLRQFFMGIPRDLFDAARIDGDSYFSMFRRIALPLAKPALIVAFVFEMQAKWFDLIRPLIYLRDTDLFTLPLGLKTILDQFGTGGGGESDWQIIMAGTVVAVVPMVILFALFQRAFLEGISTSGRKG
ncbi:MAG: carbohydrate ABC transporter permease [Thermoleophilia bacterium]|nr:carbohydrate ABC transporter permease [Thermoleophilia bacterium]